MTDERAGGHVGRLLVAALHQAITDEMPTRMDFYEHWLGGDRLRDGGVGVAAMTAVLGFLRSEGEAYHAVMSRAGRFAADWTRDAMPSMRRRWLLAIPRWWRGRAVLRLAAHAIKDCCPSSRAVVRVRHGQARIEIRQSLFCLVRESQRAPQCDFHAAMIAGMVSAFNLSADTKIEGCLAMGSGACVITVDLTGKPATSVASS